MKEKNINFIINSKPKSETLVPNPLPNDPNNVALSETPPNLPIDPKNSALPNNPSHSSPLADPNNVALL